MEQIIKEIVKEKPDWRYEHKSNIYGLNKYQVINLLNSHQACFKEIFYERQVNNIYLDTYDHQYYFDNVNGDQERLKARIRWYGDNAGEVQEPCIELKIKDGLRGYKIRKKIKKFDLFRIHEKKYYVKLIESSGISLLLKELLFKLNPVLINSYFRKYFLSFDKNFRATVDYDLSFNSSNLKHNNRIDSNNIIFELKHSADVFNVENIFSLFPFRKTRFSKYVAGIQNLFG